MKAIWHGRVVAESEQTVEVDGYVYFPRESVRMDLLRAAPKTQSDLECPHGVQFYDLVDTSERGRADRSDRAAWSYEKPKERMKKVDHWMGFWEDVETTP